METFGTLNYFMLGLYLTAMLGVGAWFARKQADSEMFFLAGRKLPWLAVAMSMYASLTSAVTYLGVPGTAYAENISLVIVFVRTKQIFLDSDCHLRQLAFFRCPRSETRAQP